MTLEEVRQKVKEVEPEVILLSNGYENNKQLLLFKCVCGKIFQKSWTTIQTHKSCLCRSCARKRGWASKRRNNNYEEEIKNIFNKNGFYPLDSIKNKREKVLCEDNKGYRGYISCSNIEKGRHFSIFSLSFNKDNLIYNLNKFSENYKTGVLIIDFIEKSRTCDTILLCKCLCGEQFESSLSDFTTQHHWRCTKCSKIQSRLEILTENELKKYTKDYKKQKRFDDCRSIETNYPLPFDFYLPKLNVCIEIDGEQHFKPSKFSNISDEQALLDLEKRQFNDKQKDQYCLKNNTKLVRISYKSFDRKNKKYQQIIKDLFT